MNVGCSGWHSIDQDPNNLGHDITYTILKQFNILSEAKYS